MSHLSAQHAEFAWGILRKDAYSHHAYARALCDLFMCIVFRGGAMKNKMLQAFTDVTNVITITI